MATRSQCITRKGVPELRGPALTCLTAIDKHLCIGLLRRVLLPPPSPVLANIHSILAYDVPDTEDVIGLPIKFWFNVGSALQPFAGSMPVNLLRR